jgi:hypothetical protein
MRWILSAILGCLLLLSVASASICYQYNEIDVSEGSGSVTAYCAVYINIPDYQNMNLTSISGTMDETVIYPRVGTSKWNEADPYSYSFQVYPAGNPTKITGNGTFDVWVISENVYGWQMTFNDYRTSPGLPAGGSGAYKIVLSMDHCPFYTSADLSSTPLSTVPYLGSDIRQAKGYEISLYYTCDVVPPTPTPTPLPDSISVNILEKYSNAALINQAITLTPTAGGAGETKTSLYGETLHFGVVPGMEYWFNASRAGYRDYNETYTIPASPGIYNVYMERILTPIANHSYAHFSVVDQTNGGLIPNAEIRLSDGQTKLTNSAGYTWFSVNNSEQINYYVSKPSGYWPAYGAFNISADESILVALQRYSGPTATSTLPGWTPVTVPTTGTGVNPVVTLSAQLRQQNVQEGMDVWYTNLPFISQFLFLLFIIGGLGLMAGGTRRN